MSKKSKNRIASFRTHDSTICAGQWVVPPELECDDVTTMSVRDEIEK